MSSFPTQGIPLQSSLSFSSTRPTSTSICTTPSLSCLRFALAWLRSKQQEHQDLVLLARSLRTQLTFPVLLTSLGGYSLSLPLDPPHSVILVPLLALGHASPQDTLGGLRPSVAVSTSTHPSSRTPPEHWEGASTASKSSHLLLPSRCSSRR